MTDPATVDVPPPPEPLKANRRSMLRRLFGRKNKNQTEGEDSIEHRGKAKGARASKKVNKKKQETPAGEDREPEAAKNVTTPKEEKVDAKPEEPKAETAPTDAPVDAPAEKVVPETVEEEATTDEENTASTAENSPEKEDGEDKEDEPEADKEDEGKETPDSEEPKDAEETEAQVQSGDDSSRDPPNLAKQAALFCGCI